MGRKGWIVGVGDCPSQVEIDTPHSREKSQYQYLARRYIV